jgi:hypothetical protein
MPKTTWLFRQTPAFRLMIATSWLAPEPWRVHQESTIREAVDAGVDWSEFINLVLNRHRTAAVSYRALSRVPDLSLPKHVIDTLKSNAFATQRSSFHLLKSLQTILKAFSERGISLMALKGPVLSIELYQDATVRHSRDLDIACRTEDLEQSCMCMLELGYQIKGVNYLHLTRKQRNAFLVCERHIELEHSTTGLQVELHWRETCESSENMEIFWDNCIKKSCLGYRIHAMNHADLILYLSFHGGRHSWFRAKWIGDLAMLYTLDPKSWDICLEKCDRQQIKHLIPSVLSLLKELYGLPMLSSEIETLCLNTPRFLLTTSLSALVREDNSSNSLSSTLLRVFHLQMFMIHIKPSLAISERLKAVLYRSADYEEISLPDPLFWVYFMLRPILFLRRKVLSRR